MSASLTPDFSRRELEQKLTKMEEKREQLLAEVETGYDETKLRDLRNLDHHIRVTSERVCGQWFREGESLEFVTSNN